VTLRNRAPVLYLARGRRSLITWDAEADALTEAARSLAHALRGQSVTVQRIDGVEFAEIPADDVRLAALAAAGFARTPSGLRLRT
jgi:ATP-dependent Lhr-like helicase